MKTIKTLLILLLSTSVLIWTGCDKDDEGAGPSSMTVKMTDAPAAFDAVFVDIDHVEVHYTENHPGAHEGWVRLRTNAGIYNLLDLRNGVTVILADGEEIPSGEVTQMRLILGSRNSVVVAGVSVSLQTPSAQTSGLKINVNHELKPRKNYELVLDFDAEKSIVAQGNGGYLLKPVITVQSVVEIN